MDWLQRSDLKRAVAARNVVDLCCPNTDNERNQLRTVKELVHPQSLIVHASKGFEQKSLKRMSVVLQEELPETLQSDCCSIGSQSCGRSDSKNPNNCRGRI